MKLLKCSQLAAMGLVSLLCGPLLLKTSAAELYNQRASDSNTSNALVLGPGDQIQISVTDLEEFSGKSYRVDPDGCFDLPLIGRFSASGLTLAQLRLDLAARLSKYIHSPQISVNVTDNQSRPVSVIGEVNSPGVHQLQGPKSLIEAIAMAGGLKPDAGPHIILTRQARRGRLPLSGETLDTTGRFSTATLSLTSLVNARNPSENILVMPDDVISVPKGDIFYVVGDVRRPGGFPLGSSDSITLLQAVSLAEGMGPNAASRHAKILRPVAGTPGKPQEIPVDVKAIFAGHAPDVALMANDILFIPNSAAKSGSRRAMEAVLQVVTGVAIYAR